MHEHLISAHSGVAGAVRRPQPVIAPGTRLGRRHDGTEHRASRDQAVQQDARRGVPTHLGDFQVAVAGASEEPGVPVTGVHHT